MTIDAALLRYYRAVDEAFPALTPDADARTVRDRFSNIAKAYARKRDDAVIAQNIEIATPAEPEVVVEPETPAEPEAPVEPEAPADPS